MKKVFWLLVLVTSAWAEHESSTGSAKIVQEAEGEGSLRVPKILQNTDIEDKAGAKLPLDVKLINQDGEHITLGKYFLEDEKIVTILTIGYFGCPMLCGLVIKELQNVLQHVSYKIGQEYRIISVSIDPKEDYHLAKEKQKTYLSSLNLPLDSDAWTFHVGDAAETKRLAMSVGFNYNYDERSQQYAHGAGFFVISPQAVLVRTMFGLSFNPQDVKLALSDGAEGKIGSLVDRVLLSCFHYDPDSHRYGVYILGVMRLGGFLTILILGLMLLVYFRQERRRTLSES